jgi:predicted ATPase
MQRLIGTGLLFRQGVPPHAIYLFKHALVQDAAYGTLLREPRRELHARIAEVLESQFADIAERQPELLARHFTEAGLIEKAAGLWGKAGQRSLARSALAEAAKQLPRALAQIAVLPPTPARRREEIKLQIAFLNSLMHVKGYASPETKAAAEKARLLIEQAEALGEPPDDPLMLFSVLYGLWGASYNAFDGAAVCELARQFLARAQKLGATVPLMMGHRLMGSSLLLAGDIAASRAHFDQAFAFYDPAVHRPLATRFGQDIGVSILVFRSYAVWLLGYPESALADAEQAIKNAREIGHAPTLMIAVANMTNILCGNYAKASMLLNELVALADEIGAHWWKALGTSLQGYIFALTGEASNAVRAINGTIDAWRSMGSTVFVPLSLLHLTKAYAELGLLDDAGRCIDEAMAAVEKTNERWFEAEIHHMAGSVALMSTRGDLAKVEAHFERALAISRKQGTRSLELRAAMSMARLWRDQGRRSEAHDLLASVYEGFTEGFDTIDLKNAKVVLDALA